MYINTLLLKKEDFIANNEVSILEPVNKKEFLTIKSIDNKDLQGKKNIGKVTKASMFIQQLPLVSNIAQNKMMEGAYKVIFPEGSIGTMMKYKNGMLGTPLVGADGKITSHAGLVPIDSISMTPLMVFTAMSAITGQYFMARINESLEEISKEVQNIIDLIYDEKESDIYAAYNFYESIRNNLQQILGNEILKISTLTNVQLTNNKLDSYIKFYSKSINREINNLKNVLKSSKFTSKRLSEMDEISVKISNFITQQHLCFELLCIGKVCEMQVAEIYDSSYCENLINELECSGEIIDKDVLTLIKKSEDVLLDIIKGANIKGNDAVSKYKKDTQKYKNKQLKFEKNKKRFIDNISDFNIENQKVKEFILIDNEVYV